MLTPSKSIIITFFTWSHQLHLLLLLLFFTTTIFLITMTFITIINRTHREQTALNAARLTGFDCEQPPTAWPCTGGDPQLLHPESLSFGTLFPLNPPYEPLCTVSIYHFFWLLMLHSWDDIPMCVWSMERFDKQAADDATVGYV